MLKNTEKGSERGEVDPQGKLSPLLPTLAGGPIFAFKLPRPGTKPRSATLQLCALGQTT